MNLSWACTNKMNASNLRMEMFKMKIQMILFNWCDFKEIEIVETQYAYKKWSQSEEIQLVMIEWKSSCKYETWNVFVHFSTFMSILRL